LANDIQYYYNVHIDQNIFYFKVYILGDLRPLRDNRKSGLDKPMTYCEIGHAYFQDLIRKGFE